MVARLAEWDVQLDAAFYCPHAPAENCRCRKPSPELLLRAAQELRIDLARSFMVGNKASDVEAGKRAGCQTILLTADVVAGHYEPQPDVLAHDWKEIAEYLLSERGIA